MKNNAKKEIKFRRKFSNQTLLQKHLDSAKNDFTRDVHTELGIKINQVKVAGHGANVENGPTTMKFLDPENRDIVLDLFNCRNKEEENNLHMMLDQANVIIGVTKKILIVRQGMMHI